MLRSGVAHEDTLTSSICCFADLRLSGMNLILGSLRARSTKACGKGLLVLESTHFSTMMEATSRSLESNCSALSRSLTCSSPVGVGVASVRVKNLLRVRIEPAPTYLFSVFLCTLLPS